MSPSFTSHSLLPPYILPSSRPSLPSHTTAQIFHMAQYTLLSLQAGYVVDLQSIVEERKDWAEEGVEGEEGVWGVWWGWHEAEGREEAGLVSNKVAEKEDDDHQGPEGIVREKRLREEPKERSTGLDVTASVPESEIAELATVHSVSGEPADVIDIGQNAPSVSPPRDTDTVNSGRSFPGLSPNLTASIDRLIARSSGKPEQTTSKGFDAHADGGLDVVDEAMSRSGTYVTMSEEGNEAGLQPMGGIMVGPQDTLITFSSTGAPPDPSATESAQSFLLPPIRDVSPILSELTLPPCSPASRTQRLFDKSRRDQTVTPVPPSGLFAAFAMKSFGLLTDLDEMEEWDELEEDGHGPAWEGFINRAAGMCKVVGDVGPSGLTEEEKEHCESPEKEKSAQTLSKQGQQNVPVSRGVPAQVGDGIDGRHSKVCSDGDRAAAQGGLSNLNSFPPTTGPSPAQAAVPIELDVIVLDEEEEGESDHSDANIDPVSGRISNKSARHGGTLETPRTKRVRESMERIAIEDSDRASDDNYPQDLDGGSPRKKIKVAVSRGKAEPWTVFQHCALVDSLLWAARPQGPHWNVIAANIRPHSPPGIVRDVSTIKKTWVMTEHPTFAGAAAAGRLHVMADVRRARAQGGANAWSKGEKVALWQGMLKAGVARANWNDVADNVNRNGPVPRDASVIKKTWMETLKKKYELR